MIQVAIDEDHPYVDFDQIRPCLHGKSANKEKHREANEAGHGNLSREEWKNRHENDVLACGKDCEE